MVEALNIAAGNNAVILLHLFDKPHSSIGILGWIDEDHCVVKDAFRASVLTGEEMISEKDTGVYAGQFIAMDAVSHPGNSRKRLD